MIEDILRTLSLTGEQSGAGNGSWLTCTGEVMESVSPIDGQTIGRVRSASREDCESVSAAALRIDLGGHVAQRPDIGHRQQAREGPGRITRVAA